MTVGAFCILFLKYLHTQKSWKCFPSIFTSVLRSKNLLFQHRHPIGPAPFTEKIILSSTALPYSWNNSDWWLFSFTTLLISLYCLLDFIFPLGKLIVSLIYCSFQGNVFCCFFSLVVFNIISVFGFQQFYCDVMKGSFPCIYFIIDTANLDDGFTYAENLVITSSSRQLEQKTIILIQSETKSIEARFYPP